MTHEIWQSSKASVDSVEIRFKTFIKKYKIWGIYVLYSGSLVHKQVRVNFKVPEYGSRFPSSGLSSQVRVNYKQLQYIQVPEYRSWFPSMGQGSWVRIFDKKGEKIQIVKSLKNNFNFLSSSIRIQIGNLPCLMGNSPSIIVNFSSCVLRCMKGYSMLLNSILLIFF